MKSYQFAAVTMSLAAALYHSADAAAQTCTAPACQANSTAETGTFGDLGFSAGDDTESAGLIGRVEPGGSGGTGSSGVMGEFSGPGVGNGVMGVTGGQNQSGGAGVLGCTSTNAVNSACPSVGNSFYGVYGSGPTGVYGTSSSGTGTQGISTAYGGSGVSGQNTNPSFGYGVAGSCLAGGCIAVLGDGSQASSPAWSGYFIGNMNLENGCLASNFTPTGIGACESDRRLKQNIQPIKGALNRLVQLRGVTYEWKTPAADGNERPTGTQMGFIAQDVEPVFPQWVGQDSKGFKNLNISPREFQALEVESIRDLKLQNDEMRDRLKALEAGRGRLTSGFGEGGIGFGLVAIAGAIVFASSRRKRTEARS